jgi:3-hydroxyisobutyrate dehydrogenase
MGMKAFLGMGLLGANFVKAMLKKGDQVQVWNRTASKASELEEFGARAFAKAADAVRGADIVHLTLKDDASVDEVLAAAAPGLKAGAIIIDHTTTSVEGAIQRTKDWKQRGFLYQHAPVFMGPPNALESTGTMLISGDHELVARVMPEISKMTGKVLNFGVEAGRAAGMKLLGNLFLVCFTTGIADMLSLAKGLHIPISDLNMLFDTWNPGAMLPGRLKRMTSGDYSKPSWELDMARKDTRLFLEEARKSGVPLAVVPGVAAEMDRWIARGFGKSDWTVIARDAVS